MFDSQQTGVKVTRDVESNPASSFAGTSAYDETQTNTIQTVFTGIILGEPVGSSMGQAILSEFGLKDKEVFMFYFDKNAPIKLFDTIQFNNSKLYQSLPFDVDGTDIMTLTIKKLTPGGLDIGMLEAVCFKE
jgi:hypothetical protein